MRNLAGDKRADASIYDELSVAGVEIVERQSDPRYSEVPYSLVGRLVLHGREFSFERFWVYWVVTCTPSLPLDEARRINELPHAADGTKYSGRAPTIGSVARAEGFAGGTDPTRDVSVWHVDTLPGLVAFVAALRGGT